MEAFLVILDLEFQRNEEHRRRQINRRIHRSLRDRSDPFSLPSVSFKRLFRFPKAAALDLIAELEPFMQHPVRSTGIPIVLKVLSALHFYGQGSYQLSVGQNYSLGLSQPSTSRALTEVTNVLNRHLMQHYIKFPVNGEHINRIRQRFAEKFNFPGVVGVIDGTLVTITTPPIHHELYPAHLFIDRKGRHSVNVQIICDVDLQILAINARYPGSVHDAAVWMVSAPKQFLEEMYNRHHRSLWLIGDSGYPNEPWLLTPVLNAEPGSPEDRFNTSLRSTRNCVERCIGVLKGRFRCLLKDRVLHYPPPVAGRIVNACAVLHNFLITRNIHWDEALEELEGDEQNAAANEPDQGAVVEGRRVRARVIRQYFT